MSQIARADNLTFTFATGGQGLPAASSYATGTLALDTTTISGSITCSVSDACIQVTLTASSGFLFWDQATNLPVFVFNDSSDTALNVFGCSAYLTNGCGNNVAPGSIPFVVPGPFEFEVGNIGQTVPCGVACNDTASTITFEVQDAVAGHHFTSVTQLESGSGTYDFAAHICQQSGSSVDCAQSANNPNIPEHAYVGGNATPEPGTLTMFGAGFLAIGLINLIRRRQARLASFGRN